MEPQTPIDLEHVTDLQRDEGGNFSYRDPKNNLVTVFAGSPGAAAWEGAWSALTQIKESEDKRLEALRGPEAVKKENWWQKFLKSLTNARDKVVQRFRRPAPTKKATALTGFGGAPQQSPSAVNPGPNPTPAQTSTPGSSRGMPAPNATHSTGAPIASKPAIQSAKPVSTPASVGPTFTVKSIIKRPDGTGYHIQFSDGIEVTIPPESPHAAHFAKVFDLTAKVDRSIDLAASGPQAAGPSTVQTQTQSTPSVSDNRVEGIVREIPPGANGKARFVFSSQGVDHPIKLTQKETEALRRAIATGQVIKVTAVRASSPAINIDTIQYSVDGAKVEESFRHFVAAVAKNPDSAIARPTEGTPSVTSAVTSEIPQSDTGKATEAPTAEGTIAQASSEAPTTELTAQTAATETTPHDAALSSLQENPTVASENPEVANMLASSDPVSGIPDSGDDGAPMGPLEGEVVEQHLEEGIPHPDSILAKAKSEVKAPEKTIHEEQAFALASVSVPEYEDTPAPPA